MISSMDNARIEFHVSGLLKMLAIEHEELSDLEEREEVDMDTRYLIARFIPKRERRRFYEMYEDYKNKLNLNELLRMLAAAYRKLSEREPMEEIDDKARHFIDEFIKIDREREIFYKRYKELTGR